MPSYGRCHTICIGRDDQAMDVLHAPIVFHQLDGQVVEQIDERRARASQTKVVDAFHQWLAEVAHPNVVNRHAGRQWIVVDG